MFAGTAIKEEAPWRPWSYIFPQTMRFIAADVANAAHNKINPNLVLVDLYFFERRHPAKRVPQIIDCAQGARADFTKSSSTSNGSSIKSTSTKGTSTNAKTNHSQWHQLDANNPLLKILCTNQAK